MGIPIAFGLILFYTIVGIAFWRDGYRAGHRAGLRGNDADPFEWTE